MLDKLCDLVAWRINSCTILPSSVWREHMPCINRAAYHSTNTRLYCNIMLSLVIFLLKDIPYFPKGHMNNCHIVENTYYSHNVFLQFFFKENIYNSVFLAYVNKKPLQPPPNKGVLYSAQQRVKNASCPGETKTEAHHVRAILTQLLQISLLLFSMRLYMVRGFAKTWPGSPRGSPPRPWLNHLLLN